MNRAELFEHHKELSGKALKLMEVKNNDYAGSSGTTPFANFERCEAMGICSTQVGMLVRITDKLSRLSTFTADGKLLVSNEGYEDAILDIINYCVLFSAFTKSKQPKPIETVKPRKFDFDDDEPKLDTVTEKNGNISIPDSFKYYETTPTPPVQSPWEKFNGNYPKTVTLPA